MPKRTSFLEEWLADGWVNERLFGLDWGCGPFEG